MKIAIILMLFSLGFVTALDANECSLAKGSSCPWCVLLYRNGGNPKTRLKSGVFCSGALIGKDLVITSASCASSAKDQDLWVQVASKRYDVATVTAHPCYDSGTRDCDIALLQLSSIVNKRGSYACLMNNRTDIPVDQCYVQAYRRSGKRDMGDCRLTEPQWDGVIIQSDEILITQEIAGFLTMFSFTMPFSVNSGACNQEDNVPNHASFCGINEDFNSKDTFIPLGSPVLCPYQDGFGLWGVVNFKDLQRSIQITSLASIKIVS